MARVVPPLEIIDLDETSDSDMDYADFLTSEGEAAVGVGVEDLHHDPNNQGQESYDTTPITDPHDYLGILQEVLQVFPDISHEHVHDIYKKDIETGSPYQVGSPSQVLIEKILDGTPYPKERDKKKRKYEDRNSEDEEAARWKYADLRDDPEQYQEVAIALSDAFRKVPVRSIENTYSQHNHYYGAYFAILEAERSVNSAKDPLFIPLKARRVVPKTAAEKMSQLEQQGYDFDKLKKEIESASRRHRKDTAKREAIQQAKLAEEAEDERLRAEGETMECQCCFDDFTSPKVTHCNGDDTHFFCLDCARQNANTDIGNSRYELRCMDGSGCKATFSRSERVRFLDLKTIEKLERLQQQEEIRMAELQNLSTCPFCDFAAICPPIEEDREFRCHNPRCEEVSCRLCKAKTHIPLSCEEFKKENGVSERRVIEEARTEALIRTCGKCKVRILKEDGCNKVICSSCSAVICDYCGQDISKQMYNHFDGQGRAPPGLITNGPGAKCPLYDESNKRKDDQVQQAEKEAMAKVRAEHPDLSEDDLRIKFAKSVQSPPKRPSYHHHFGHHHHPHRYVPDDYGLPEFGRFRVDPAFGMDPAVNHRLGRHVVGDAERPRIQTPEELYQAQLAQQQLFRDRQEALRLQAENQRAAELAERDRIVQEHADRLRRGREHVRNAGERARAAGEQTRAAMGWARIAGVQAQAQAQRRQTIEQAQALRRQTFEEFMHDARPNNAFEQPYPFGHIGQQGPGHFNPDTIFGANANPIQGIENHDNSYRGVFNGPINPNGPLFTPFFPSQPQAPEPQRQDIRAEAMEFNERRPRRMEAAIVDLDPPTPPRPHYNQWGPAVEVNDEVNLNPWLNGPGLNDQPPRNDQGFR